MKQGSCSCGQQLEVLQNNEILANTSGKNKVEALKLYMNKIPQATKMFS